MFVYNIFWYDSAHLKSQPYSALEILLLLLLLYIEVVWNL